VERSGCALKVRGLEPGDVDAILSIQAESPEVAQWSRGAYERFAQEKMIGWTAEADGSISGFVTARQVTGDAEILNFAVRSDARRSGVGTLLLNEVLAWAESARIEKIYLEVRESNRAARAFYERRGFHETGRRPRYYEAPTEDALLLALSLDSKASRG
jgi:ribosomal-protein-alanine acetyltransferase